MDKLSEKIIRILTIEHKKSGIAFIRKLDLLEQLKMPDKENLIDGAVFHLYEQGFIIIDEKNYFIDDTSSLFLTYKGIIYQENTRTIRQQFVLEKIILPIIVSAVTAFIVALITSTLLS